MADIEVTLNHSENYSASTAKTYRGYVINLCDDSHVDDGTWAVTSNSYTGYKINSNNEGVTKMKVFVKFMKPKDASKRNPFNSLIAKVVKPKLTGEFENMDDLNSYATDPRHLAVASICKEIALERVAIDFEE